MTRALAGSAQTLFLCGDFFERTQSPCLKLARRRVKKRELCFKMEDSDGMHDGRGVPEESASCGGSAATARIGNNRGATMSLSATSLSIPSDVRDILREHAVREEGAVTATLEVKYDEGATELFVLVEDARWEEVCDRLVHCKSEILLSSSLAVTHICLFH